MAIKKNVHFQKNRSGGEQQAVGSMAKKAKQKAPKPAKSSKKAQKAPKEKKPRKKGNGMLMPFLVAILVLVGIFDVIMGVFLWLNWDRVKQSDIWPDGLSAYTETGEAPSLRAEGWTI